MEVELVPDFDDFMDNVDENDLLFKFFHGNEIVSTEDKFQSSTFDRPGRIWGDDEESIRYSDIFSTQSDASHFENLSTNCANTTSSECTIECAQIKIENYSSPRNVYDTHLSPFFRSVSSHKSNATTFQKLKESRIKYLCRFPKLYQEFFNSGNFDMLKILFDDVIAKDIILITQGNQQLMGRERFHQLLISIYENIPDMCIFFNEIVHSKKRLINMNGNSFGTFPYANSCDKSRAAWNIFEYALIEKLDEYHKIQKQKYDVLKSQNKPIKFERRATWHFILTRDLKCVKKIVTFTEKTEICL